MEIIQESLAIVNRSRNLDTKMSRLQLVISQARHLQQYEDRNIPTVDPSPSDVERLAAKELDAIRAEQPTKISPMVSTGPPLNVTSPETARASGIQGAQWSSGPHACPLCRSLDGLAISIDHPDFIRFNPKMHPACESFWIYVGSGQTHFSPDWETPPDDLLQAYAPYLLNQ